MGERITVSLFPTLIRPHLEYASQVWAPHYNSNINRIEKFQKSFVKFALNHLNRSDPLNYMHEILHHVLKIC